MCVSVYSAVGIYTCVCICVFGRVLKRLRQIICVYVGLFVWKFFSLYMCVCEFAIVCFSVCVCVCLSVFVFVCVFVCVHVCVCV